MNNKIYILLLFLFSLGTSQAQLIFNLPNPASCTAGESLDLDVTVENYDNLVAMQFTIAWNAGLLNYVSIDNFHPNLGNTPQIVTQNAASGSVNYSWTAEPGDFANGVDIPDGAVLFTLHFSSTASTGTTSIAFDNSNIPVVVEDNQGNIDNMITVNGGSVAVGDTQMPAITCPTNYTANSPDGNPVQITDDLSSMPTDNCTVAAVTYSSTGATFLMSPTTGINDVTGQSFAVGTTTVTYEVTDGVNLTNTCDFEVLITNNSNDVILDIEDYLIGCSNSGSNIALQVFVENFNNVTGISLQIAYDANLLTLLPSSDFHPNMDGFNNGDLNSPSAGILNVFWQTSSGNNATGVDVPNGESIFTLNFTPDPALANTVVDFNVNLVSLVGNVPANVSGMSGVITTAITGSAADLSGDATICSGESTDLFVTITGGTPPYTLIYNDGNMDITINDYQSNDAIAVSPNTSTTYTLVNVTDAGNCPAIINDNMATITVNPSPTDATFLGNADTCPGDTTILMVNITGGTAPFTITYTENIPGMSTPVTLNNYQNNEAIIVFPNSTTVYTVTNIIDANGCALMPSNASAIVMANDENPPLITCPAPIVQDTNPGMCGAVVTFQEATATDDCDDSPTVILVTDIPSGDEFPVGTNTVIFMAQDNANNSVSCSFDIIIEDNEFPDVTGCPPSLSPLYIADAGQCSAIVNFVAPTATDNCGNISVTNSHNSGDAFNVGSTPVTFTFTDDSGNLTTCNFTINVIENEAPTIICPDDITVSPDMGNTTATVNGIAPVAADNCGIDNTSFELTGATTGSGVDDVSGTTFNSGETVVIYTTEDESELTATCDFTITVMENNVFTLDCPPNQTAISANDSCGITLFNLAPNASPMSDVASITYALSGATTAMGNDDASGIFYNVGITNVTYTATDNGGNELDCSFAIEVNDTIPPVFTLCPADIVGAPSDAGICGAMINYENPMATDDCSAIDTIICSTISGTVFPVGTTTVTCTAMDVLGNMSAVCSFDITVVDAENPTIDCPPSQTVSAGMTGNSATVDNLAPLVADNCGIDTTYFILTGATVGEGANDASGTNFNLGETTITYTTQDNNDSIATCNLVITVIDDSGLVLTCPANQLAFSSSDACGVIVNDIQAMATPTAELDTITYQLTGATSAVGGNDASGNFFNIGTTNVLYIATDTAGNTLNCSFTVMVSDTIMPVIVNCPPSISINVAPNSCANTATWIAPTATDNCPGLVMTSSHNPGASFPVGNTIVSYLAADASGNKAVCSFTVTVVDNILPVIANCPDDIVVAAASGDCSATASWISPTVSDNCPNPTLSSTDDSGDEFSIGENSVIYIAADASGNQTTCSFTVTVIDTEAPVIADCPENIIVSAMGTDCSATVNWTPPTVTDNCPNVFFTGNPTSGGVFSTGTTAVNYIASDASGNTDQCTFTVTVQDNENPTVSFCPPNMTVDALPNECFANITWSEPNFEDNCGIISIVANFDSGDAFNVGAAVDVIYEANDAYGNTVTCTFTVQVTDNQPPTIFALPNDMVVNTTPGVCGAVVNYIAPQVLDNCAIANFSTPNPSGSEFPLGQTTVIYTAVDVNNNIALDSFTITVIDSEAPKINCFENVEVTVDGNDLIDPSGIVSGLDPVDCDEIFVTVAVPTFSDNCQMANFSQTQGNTFTSGTPFPIGTTVIEYTATDISGNESVCQFTVTVNSISFPTINLSSIFPCEGDDFLAQVAPYPNAIFNWYKDNILVNTGTSFSIPNISLANAGAYTVEMVLPTCTISQPFQLSVFENPVIQAMANDVLCTDGSQDLNLTATLQNGVTVNEWQWIFNGNIVYTEQNPTIENVTQAQAGQYIVRGISSNGCLSADTITVNITAVAPMPNLTASEETICTGASITLMAQSYNGNAVEYSWNADPILGSGLVDVNNFNTTATPVAAGVYTYTFFATVDGCQTATAQVTVTVEEPPVLSPLVDGNLECVDGTTGLTLMGNVGNADATYLWTFNNDFLSNEENVVLDNITNTESGDYKLVVTFLNGCQTEAVIPINITEQPAAPDPINGDTLVCDGEPITLSGTNYGNDATYIWLLNDLPIPNSDEPLVTFSPQTGTNLVTFSAIIDGCNTGIVSTDLMVEMAPESNLTIVGSTNCLDGNTPLTVLSNSSDAASGFWLNENNIQVSNEMDLVIENANAGNTGNYYFVAESLNGCRNIDTIAVAITDGLPPIDALLVGQPCEDGNLSLSSTDIPNATYAWTNPAGMNFSSAREPLVSLISPESNGFYTVTASGADGCSTTDSVEVAVLVSPTAIDDEIVAITEVSTEFNVLLNDGFEADRDLRITILQSTTQGVLTQLNNGTFSYTPNADFLETDMFAYQICYDECPSTCDIAFVQLNVQFPEDNCIATTVITPNNDGINDRFVIFCLDVQEFPANELVIFGSWGDEVFRMKGYDNSWKGTYEGEPLPDGTYYYIFKRDDNAEPDKGFIMIYR